LQHYAIVALAGGLTVSIFSFHEQNRLATFSAAFTLALAGQIVKITADTSIQQNMIDAFRGRTFSLFDMTINMSLVLGISLFALNDAMRQASYATVVFACSIGLAIGVIAMQRTTD
jgi:hypothetical protein